MADAFSSLWFILHFTHQRAGDERPFVNEVSCCVRQCYIIQCHHGPLDRKKRRSPSGLQTCWLWHIIGFCSFRFIIRLEKIISSSVFWRRTEKQNNFLSVQFVSGGTPHLLRLTRSHYKFTDSEGCFCLLSFFAYDATPADIKKKGRRLCAFPISSCGAPRGAETLWTPAEETRGAGACVEKLR